MTDSLVDSVTLTQAVAEFLDWQALDKGRSPNTVRAYQQDLLMSLAYATEFHIGLDADGDFSHHGHRGQDGGRGVYSDRRSAR